MRRACSAVALALFSAACGISAVGLEAASDDASTDATPAADGASPARDASGSEAGDASTTTDASVLDADADAAFVDPYTTRTTSGLVALYDFEENAGTTAGDQIAPQYDLTISDGTKVTWHPHYLEVKDYTSLTNTATFTKLVTRTQPTHEVTVEAWVKITGVVGGGSANYGRLVSIIEDSNSRDIDMGQKGTSLWASMLSSSTQIEKGPVSNALHHLVLTRTQADQTLRLYVDGALFHSATNVNDPATFAAYRMFVANSFNGDRGITGDLHLLAFYDVALTPTQVTTNYQAGADPTN